MLTLTFTIILTLLLLSCQRLLLQDQTLKLLHHPLPLDLHEATSGDVSLPRPTLSGLLTFFFALTRMNCFTVMCITLVSLSLFPTLIQVGFAAVPVFTDFCCCFGLDVCLIADLTDLNLDAGCGACQPFEWLTADYTRKTPPARGASPIGFQDRLV